MATSTAVYWNPLAPEAQQRRTPVPGLEDMAEELTLSLNPETGKITRLTRFLPGADTTPFGPKAHLDMRAVTPCRLPKGQFLDCHTV